MLASDVNSGSYAVFISLSQFSLVCITFGTCVSIFHIFIYIISIYIYIIIYLYILIYTIYMISIYIYIYIRWYSVNVRISVSPACWAQGQAAKLHHQRSRFLKEHGAKGPSPNLATTCSELQLTNGDVRHFTKRSHGVSGFFVRGL